jgi:hypothetical protein
MSSAPLRNLSRRTKVYWKDYGHWSCGRHLPSLVLPATIDRCWLCPNKRPAMDTRPPMPEGFEELQAKPKAPTKKGKAPRRTSALRKTSELDAMLTGGLPPPENAVIEARPAAPRRAAARATTTPSTPAEKAASKKTAATSAQPGTDAEGHVCVWQDCEQIARPRSKYCSRNCSNKNARSRHKARDV